MAKKAIKKDTPAAPRRFGVILESIDSQVKQIWEGHAGLDKKFDTLDQKVDDFRHETRGEFTMLNLFKSNTTNRLKDMELSLTAIRKYLSKIDDEIQELKKRLTGKTEIARLERVESEVVNIRTMLK